MVLCAGKDLDLHVNALSVTAGEPLKRTAPFFSRHARNTCIFMSDAKATLYHLWIHYQILKTALCVSLSNVRITDVPILATCPGGSVESVIEAETEYWIARAFYKPASDRETHKQQCGPTEGHQHESHSHRCTHTHTRVLRSLWRRGKSHFLSFVTQLAHRWQRFIFCRDINACAFKKARLGADVRVGGQLMTSSIMQTLDSVISTLSGSRHQLIYNNKKNCRQYW